MEERLVAILAFVMVVIWAKPRKAVSSTNFTFDLHVLKIPALLDRFLFCAKYFFFQNFKIYFQATCSKICIRGLSNVITSILILNNNSSVLYPSKRYDYI